MLTPCSMHQQATSTEQSSTVLLLSHSNLEVVTGWPLAVANASRSQHKDQLSSSREPTTAHHQTASVPDKLTSISPPQATTTQELLSGTSAARLERRALFTHPRSAPTVMSAHAHANRSRMPFSELDARTSEALAGTIHLLSTRSLALAHQNLTEPQHAGTIMASPGPHHPPEAALDTPAPLPVPPLLLLARATTSMETHAPAHTMMNAMDATATGAGLLMTHNNGPHLMLTADASLATSLSDITLTLDTI